MMSNMATGQSDCCLFIDGLLGNSALFCKVKFATAQDFLVFGLREITDVGTNAVRVVVITINSACGLAALGVAAEQPNVLIPEVPPTTPAEPARPKKARA